MSTWSSLARVSLVAALSATLAAGGCVFSPGPSGNSDSNTNTNSNANGNGGGSGTTITIRFFNNTDATLDPDLHVTGSAVTDVGQLFAAGNKYTRFGVGTRGLLGPRDTDTFTLDCSTARLIGTPGGFFGDDLDNPEGVGQQRVFTQDVTFTCGDTITFVFGRSGSTFSTGASVTR